MNFSYLLPRLRAEWRKRAGRELSAADVHPRFRDRERHFRAPPMTAEMVAAISRLSPQFHLETGETSRSFWELTQNGSCWGEFDAAAPVLRTMPRPGKTLDIGCGLGRSTAFFRRALGWNDTEFHLYDGDGPRIDYPRSGERTDRSFCGDLTTLRPVLEYNEVPRFRVFDAHELDHRLDALPGPYDLVYSFYAAGFHWSLADFWSEFEALSHRQTVGIFTIHRNFEEFPALDSWAVRIVPFERSLIKDRPHRLLIACRDEALLRPLEQTGGR
jgi:SAM-dependent methyltransferase